MKRYLDHATCNSKPGEKTRKLRDGGGLFLHVEPSGARGWRFYYRRPISEEAEHDLVRPFPGGQSGRRARQVRCRPRAFGQGHRSQRTQAGGPARGSNFCRRRAVSEGRRRLVRGGHRPAQRPRDAAAGEDRDARTDAMPSASARSTASSPANWANCSRRSMPAGATARPGACARSPRASSATRSRRACANTTSPRRSRDGSPTSTPSARRSPTSWRPSG